MVKCIKPIRGHHVRYVGLLPLRGLWVCLITLKSLKSKISLYNNTI